MPIPVSQSGQFKYLKMAFLTGGLVLAGAMIRAWPLGILGVRIPWLTFYPAVAGAALFGGFPAGVTGALLSCSIVIFGWPWIAPRPFLQDSADWLGLIIFFFNCLIISAMAESSRRAKSHAVRAKEEAERANRAKSIFLANMSHELRTPLNAILGFSEMMFKESTLNPDQKHKLDMIHRSGEHLLALIDDVLNLTKVESGRLTLESKPLDLQGLTEEVTGIMQVRADQKGLELTVQKAPNVPRFILGDATRLRQVLVNLLNNAIRYTDRGSVSLNLKIKDSAPYPFLVMEVSDTGRGIAQEDKERIFEPMVQVGAKPDQGGAGLGLAIIRQFINLMGGRIEVESRLEHGSIFRTFMPLKIPVMTPPAETIPGQTRVVGLAPGQPVPRILIVEDQEENWSLLEELLQKAGLQVRVAQNGLLGVEAFKDWHPDLIWMDCRMPELDGLEATRRIRALESTKGCVKQTKIVALTASVFADERDKVLAAGMDDFLRKPFRSEDLFACLKQHLGLEFLMESAAPRQQYPPLDRQALEKLTPAQRQALRESLLSLNSIKIQGVISQIAEEEPALGERLAHEAQSLAYSRLLSLLSALQEIPA